MTKLNETLDDQKTRFAVIAIEATAKKLGISPSEISDIEIK